METLCSTQRIEAVLPEHEVHALLVFEFEPPKGPRRVGHGRIAHFPSDDMDHPKGTVTHSIRTSDLVGQDAQGTSVYGGESFHGNHASLSYHVTHASAASSVSLRMVSTDTTACRV